METLFHSLLIHSRNLLENSTKWPGDFVKGVQNGLVCDTVFGFWHLGPSFKTIKILS